MRLIPWAVSQETLAYQIQIRWRRSSSNNSGLILFENARFIFIYSLAELVTSSWVAIITLGPFKATNRKQFSNTSFLPTMIINENLGQQFNYLS